MEWLIDVALAIMIGICALSMLRMTLRGWCGAGRHVGHGMICMGHSAEGVARTPGRGSAGQAG